MSEDGLSRQEVPGGKREGRTEVLANLEDFDDEAIIPGITVTPQAEAEDGSVSTEDEAGKEPDFIENADVRLSDLISKFWQIPCGRSLSFVTIRLNILTKRCAMC